jgi:putative adenylate-forming enzyme
MRTLERLLIVYYFLYYRYVLRFRSRAGLERWQSRRVTRLARWLNRSSPFYAERLRGLAHPLSMPPIDKHQMMEGFDRLNTRGLSREEALRVAIASELSRDFTPTIGGVTVGLSSGTSGSRGLFCAAFRERARYAGAILAKALPGTKGPRRVAFFLRANSNLYESVGSRQLAFRYFDLLQPLREHVEGLREFQPTFLIGPPSLLLRLAEAVQGGGLSLPALQRVYSVAEVLEPRDQQNIEQALGRPVHQIYQCTEGFLAISCTHGQLHLNEDLALIEKEWLDRDLGKFMPVITDFNRRTQPIFRYRLNDILTEDPTPCPCGSVMTRLKRIEGRCDDMIHLRGPAGWIPVFPDFVRNAILYASPRIQEYLVRQETDGRLRISLKGDDPTGLEKDVGFELKRLAERLGALPPSLEFDHRFPELGLKKLRRVSSAFDPRVACDRQAAILHEKTLTGTIDQT